MQSTSVSAQGYSSLGQHIQSARDMEYDVILRVTRELKKVSLTGHENFPKFVAALNMNERLWTEIGTQVADASNELPAPLKTGLFALSQFVAQHTNRLLRGEGDIATLVETNVAVLRGLKGKG